jgi:diacylglycerol kinase family enzyme
MNELSPWCVIVNLQTCRRGWNRWKWFLRDHQIPHSFYKTKSIAETSQLLAGLIAGGNRYFLFVGGDGTIHHGGNLLLHHAGDGADELVIGVLPCGTGNDWVRTFGVRRPGLAESLILKSSVPLPLLKIEWPDGSSRYAFNMVGGALDAAVVDSLNTSSWRIPGAIKYPIALLNTLRKPHTWHGSITIDGEVLDGQWLTIQAGFGKYCGGGMYVLPHAEEEKAALLLMRPKSFGKILISLPKIYNGKIGRQPEAVTRFFEKLEIQHQSKPIPIESDGEYLGTSPIVISVIRNKMRRLDNLKVMRGEPLISLTGIHSSTNLSSSACLSALHLPCETDGN